jgi:hypothetical protein
MKPLVLAGIVCASLTAAFAAEVILFQDQFAGRLGPGWSWVREHRQAWRVGERGLEVQVEPGNMWGSANNARNVLVRPAPETTNGPVEVSVTVENHPSSQYEQVDLVWYYDDSHMVKLGQELVDGKLSVVMGREEKDQTRTIAIVPLASRTVHLRLRVEAGEIQGAFRLPGTPEWQVAGKCSLPAPADGLPRLALQFYQGPADAEHWARVTDFRVVRAQ